MKFEGIGRDVRYAARQMVANRGFTTVAVLTLALGIGGTTALFSVLNAVVLKPLPYDSADRLVWVAEALPQRAEDAVPGAHFLEWSAQSGTVDQIAAYNSAHFTLTGVGEPERLDGVRVSASFLGMLGVRPALGRLFLPAEDRPGAQRVAIISHALRWD
jgi:hypothetical protein